MPDETARFSQMGLMMRDALNDNAPFVSLMIYPAYTSQIELPDWRVKKIARFGKKEKIDTSAISVSNPKIKQASAAMSAMPANKMALTVF